MRTTTSQKCAAVPRRARIEGSKTFVSPNSRLDSNKEEEEEEDGHLRAFSGRSWTGPGRSLVIGPVVPSFRALSGRLNFTARRHKSNKDYLLY